MSTRIRPKPIYGPPRDPAHPQCRMPASKLTPQRANEIEWRIKHYGGKGIDPNFCTKHQVAIMPNGKGYCSFHAGAIALALHLGEEPDYGD